MIQRTNTTDIKVCNRIVSFPNGQMIRSHESYSNFYEIEVFNKHGYKTADVVCIGKVSSDNKVDIMKRKMQ